jgi:hypothetical protein
MKGLLSQKPDSTSPQVGEQRRFTIEQRVSKAGKAWTKLKNAMNGEGTLCNVTAVRKTDFVDAHDNVSYNVEFETSTSQEPKPTRQGASTARQGQDDRSSRIERQHSQEQAIRYATLKGLTTITTEELRALIDWFQRDVGHVPSSLSSRDVTIAQAVTEDANQDEEPF